MSLSFIQEMQLIANDESLQEEMKDEVFKEKQNKIKHELFLKLSQKYYWLIVESIKYASMNGKTYKYLNFCRKDFKADFPGVGNPVSVQEQWLDEIIKPHSKYIPAGGRSLIGIQYNIWNNRSFTTVITWGSTNLDRDGTK
uniref:Uncharacterized protein n=1 Tax=Nucleocytoviricota sp. TaxID=2809609 RepID=A0A9E8GBI1_9VIRU|nr:hypothetical protein [Nucleocytoviricota sp.]UZT29315.1 hypothetical protein [Nucleocytoviricota sp.]